MEGWREGGERGRGFLAASQDTGSCQSLQWERNSAAIKPGFITTRPEMEGEDGDRDGGRWRGEVWVGAGQGKVVTYRGAKGVKRRRDLIS